ncbi:hypothetical protein AB4072_08390 [Microvirga sp. 2MCAF38]|uniref:hypothetical protein n=1 Tax=Microvirga sp. 2MCAF38 TaxID=3232989 RepID=UPI003F97B260
MLSQFGIEGSRAAQYVIAFAIILALVLLFAWVLRRLTGGRLLLPGQDRGRSRQPRLGVVDVYDLDRQRQLILLRRDNVEHLLLVGGLNDVVIETNIVRVAGARPNVPSEPVIERPEPVLEPAQRPQIDQTSRPNIEAQLAAQLGAFIRRPSEESDAEQELAPVASVSAPVTSQPMPTHVEPVLKPTHVEPILTASRAESLSRPVHPSFEPKLPEPPAPRPEPRVVAPPPPPAPPVFRAPQPTPPVPPEPVALGGQRVPDALILSDMAKQLEEALKRPAAPVSSAPQPAPVYEPAIEEVEEETVEIEIDRTEISETHVIPRQEWPLEEPAIEEEVEPQMREEEEAHPSPAPVEQPRAAEQQPAPKAPTEAQPAPAPAAPRTSVDPFSVEEIEAEFARLLGRSTDTGSKG